MEKEAKVFVTQKIKTMMSFSLNNILKFTYNISGSQKMNPYPKNSNRIEKTNLNLQILT